MSNQVKLAPRHQQQFTEMLPLITQIARSAFRDRDPEARQEMVAEAVAAALGINRLCHATSPLRRRPSP